MDKEFKALLETSSKAIEKLQDKVEEFTEEFSGDASALWDDMKTNFSTANEKLKTAAKDLDQKSDEANLQAHLGTMEAHARLENIKDTISDFTEKVSAKAHTELDTAALRAHLAKMEAEDFWDKKGQTITDDFNESKDKVQKLAMDAASEIKDYFEKLTETLSKKE
ncbi:MAG: hypothetical protein K0U47_03610 [Epsilonproteobacteria bacterium]|nr:hypothetical protein [Campylobacterota bacterium]